MSIYLPVLFLILISFILSSILVIASYWFAVQLSNSDKLSPYECGFDPYGDARQKFEVKFFLVGILFIIFDLEISYLFPWSVLLNSLPILSFWILLVFLIILTIGLVYEWLKGGLEWQ